MISYRALVNAGVAEPVARRMALEPIPTTDDLAHLPVGQACAHLAKARGWTVQSLERPGRTRYLEGLPDLRLRLPGAAIWWEAKSSKDKLSAAQLAWLLAEHEAGEVVGAGGVAELGALLTAWERDESPRALGLRLVRQIEARGLRRER